MRKFLYNDVRITFYCESNSPWSDIPGTTVTSHIISRYVDKTRSKE